MVSATIDQYSIVMITINHYYHALDLVERLWHRGNIFGIAGGDEDVSRTRRPRPLPRRMDGPAVGAGVPSRVQVEGWQQEPWQGEGQRQPRTDCIAPLHPQG